MTLFTMQGDTVIMKEGAVGTEAACCCIQCECGETVSCREGYLGPVLILTFGNGDVVEKCLKNTSINASGSTPGGLPDGNKLPSPFADPSIAVWTCVDGRYQIYTNLGTCFLTIYMTISVAGNCGENNLNFDLDGWENEAGCSEGGSIVDIGYTYEPYC